MKTAKFKSRLSDDCIMTAINEARPMVRNLARHYDRLEDVEDLLQDLSIILLTRPLPANVRNLPAFLQTVMRYECIDLLTAATKRHPHHMSIDAPLNNEGFTLADTLAAPAPVAGDDPDQQARDQALYAALRRLDLDEQQEMCNRYELNAFQPLPPDRYYAGYKPRKRLAKSARWMAYVHLRRDSELGQLVAGRSA